MTPLTPLDELYEQHYRPDKHAQPRQRATVAQFRVDLRNLARYCGELAGGPTAPPRSPAVGELRDELLKGAMAWQLARGRSASTANRLYRTIAALWRWAYFRRRAERLVAEPPCTEPYRELRRLPDAWSEAELAALLAAARQAPGRVGGVPAGLFWAAYLELVAASGARFAVALAVPAANFDAGRGEILLPAELQKQAADQLVELVPSAVAALAALRSRERGLDRLLGDWTASASYFNGRLRRVVVAAGLRPSVDQVTRRDLSHKIRRTFGTRIARRAGEEVARQLLGHSSISVTRGYLDPRQIERPSARAILAGDEPPAATPEERLRIWRPPA